MWNGLLLYFSRLAVALFLQCTTEVSTDSEGIEVLIIQDISLLRSHVVTSGDRRVPIATRELSRSEKD